jgi:hypothetical protein
MSDGHAEHVEFVRAALRDELGLSDAGGTVAVDADGLTRLAATARKAVLTWLLGAAANGKIEAHVCDEMCSHG